MSEQAKADWYPDPSGDPGKLRYWNGTAWTDDYTVVTVNQGASEKGNGKLLAAFIFCLIETVVIGLLLVPLCWCIPMTVHTWKIYKGKAQITTGFAVCTLIFMNVVSGILLLVNDKE